jgi:hypothetical protein
MKALVAAAAGLLVAGSLAAAQPGMPDARQMSGMPLPMGEMTPGTVTVRVVRGNVANIIANQKVELTIGGETRSAQTDDSGRATFENLKIGETVLVRAVVGGETLDSQEFQVPAQGGIRLMLVATDPHAAKEADEAARQAAAAAQPGTVSLGSQSRIHVELGEEAADVYYLLDITNPAKTPVQPQAPFAVELPGAASGGSVLEGSNPNATLAGRKLTVRGPFAPGATIVQVAFRLPYSGSRLEFRQAFPAAFDQPVLSFTRKLPNLTLVSSTFHEAREVANDGQVLLVAHAKATPANAPLDVRIDGVPSHAAWPRYLALLLAGAFLLGGAYGVANGPRRAAQKSAAAKQLETRREKLLSDLASLEQRHRSGSVSDGQYERRRAEIVEALERVYGDLDDSAAA